MYTCTVCVYAYTSYASSMLGMYPDVSTLQDSSGQFVFLFVYTPHHTRYRFRATHTREHTPRYTREIEYSAVIAHLYEFVSANTSVQSITSTSSNYHSLTLSHSHSLETSDGRPSHGKHHGKLGQPRQRQALTFVDGGCAANRYHYR